MEKREIINNIIENQRLFSRYMRQNEPDAWLNLNLTIAQVKSLFFLAHHSEVNFRTLAKALKVTPSNVTGIIDRLSEQGLVLRQNNPLDRRMLMLQLTPEGEKLISSLRERRVSNMLAILNGLPEDDLKIINTGFTLMAEAVKTQTEPTL
jgi:MarR family transcriptional regulator, organic hydroperoxide resistance regulator